MCTQQRLGSAWTSAKVNQTLLCQGSLMSMLANSKDSDRMGICCCWFESALDPPATLLALLGSAHTFLFILNSKLFTPKKCSILHLMLNPGTKINILNSTPIKTCINTKVSKISTSTNITIVQTLLWSATFQIFQCVLFLAILKLYNLAFREMS